MLVRVEGGAASRRTDPARAARATNEEDLRLAEELNAREDGQHVMLVDLGRNESAGLRVRIGRVRAVHGLERFSHVMHLTSIVEGNWR